MPPEIRTRKESYGWRVECLLDGEVISWLGVDDRLMRIGSSTLKMGGISGVGTLRGHRRRGYSRMCMVTSNDLMQREGYDVGFLFGIGDFYDKFGYITCMPEHTFAIDTRDAECAQSNLKNRPVRRSDWPDIARLYNRNNTRQTGSCYRHPSRWAGFAFGSSWGRNVATRVIHNGHGKLAGYVAYDDETDEACSSEVGGTDPAIYAAVLRFMAQRAVKLRREHISFKVPISHPFAMWARRFGIVDQTRYPRNSNAMGRIMNLVPCLRRLSDELTRRLAGRIEPTALRIKTDIGTCHFSWTGTEVTISDRGRGALVQVRQDHLMQLLMGYRPVSDLVATGDLKAPRTLLPMLETVFPVQTAQLWWPDRF